MKTKLRFMFLGAALFVIIVSYKILEPELFRTEKTSYSVDDDPFMAGFKEEEPLDKIEDHHRNIFYDPDVDDQAHVESNHVGSSTNLSDKAEVVKAMIDRFTPMYSHQLRESPWDIAANWVEPRQIHPSNAQELGAILWAMAKGKITAADVGFKGTQLKLTLVIDGKQKVVFKPAWYQRDYVVTGTPYAGRDRHNAEIAAFHLGRLLELRRTPLAIGRRVNIHTEIIPVASERLLSTFFERNGETCFYGKCLYCNGPQDGVCASNGVLEGTLVLWLPSSFKMTLHKHPWSRTYRDNVKAKWEVNNAYCDSVKSSPNFSSGPRLLDIIDTCVFDYLIGNADRHHYETFQGMDDSMLIMLDNGKSFGNPDVDEITILAPLYQCCQIRSTLWRRLLAFQESLLSRVLAAILYRDPISPILTEAHLQALDRRLKTVLEEVHKCVKKVGVHAIVLDTDAKHR